MTRRLIAHGGLINCLTCYARGYVKVEGKRLPCRRCGGRGRYPEILEAARWKEPGILETGVKS